MPIVPPPDPAEHASALPSAAPRRSLPLLLVPIGVMIIASNVANVTYATLVEAHPLWLLGLSSINRYLALVTPHTALWSYLLVGFLRLLAPDPFFYLLGYWYRDRGVRAIEARLPSVGNYYRQFERLFRRASYPVVFVAPNNAVCLFAGAARMSPVGFAVANVTGTIARLALIRVLGNVFGSPIRSTTGWLDQWKWWILAASALILVIGLLSDRRRGRSDLSGLRHLGDDLSDESEPGRAAGAGSESGSGSGFGSAASPEKSSAVSPEESSGTSRPAGAAPGSEAEVGVEADGHAGVPGDPFHRE